MTDSKDVPKRKCPQCKNWEFDDQSHWCKKDYLRLTYTSLTLPEDEKNAMYCEDYDPLENNEQRDMPEKYSFRRRYSFKRKPVSRK